MPKVDESKLTIELEKQGRTLDNAVSWYIDADYVLSTDAFGFSLYDKDLSQIRDLELQPVKLRVADALQLVGRIDQSVAGDNGTAISYEGRDYIADMVECAIEPTLSKLKEGITLFEAITQIAGPVGVDTVLGDDDLPLRDVRTGKSIAGASPKDFQPLKVEELKADIGIGIYDFLNRVVARHSATIQPALNRNELLITAPDYSQSPAYSLNRRIGSSSGANNIISATATKDFSRFPTHALFTGDQSRAGTRNVPVVSALGIAAGTSTRATAAAVGSVNSLAALGVYVIADAVDAAQKATPTTRTVPVDTSQSFSLAERAKGFAPTLVDLIRAACHIGRRKGNAGPLADGALYRLLAHRDSESRNAEQVAAAAKRAVGDRLKDTLIYQATVQGHVDPETGAVWSIDTMVDVQDEVANVFEPLWIAKRTLRFDSKTGATTELTCWRPGAFTV